MPYISIIFPTHNGWQDTQECLKSIAKINYPQEKIEVIVVDNASKDIKDQKLPIHDFVSTRSGKIKKTYKKLNIQFILNKRNLGFAKAVNQGLRKTKGEFLLVTNNDVVFDKEYLNKLVKFLSEHPKVGIVGGI